MWETSVGIRRLRGAERRLFIRAALELCKHMQPGRRGRKRKLGVPGFDNATPADRRFRVLWCGEHLLNTVEAPTLLAWNENAIHAVFLWIREGLAADVLLAPSTIDWRSLVLDAWKDNWEQEDVEEFDRGADKGPLQSAVSLNFEEWEEKIEALTDQILWDRDFELEPLFLDAHPDRAAYMKEFLGIRDDYFTAPSPIWSDQEMRRLDLFQARLEHEAAHAELGYLSPAKRRSRRKPEPK